MAESIVKSGVAFGSRRFVAQDGAKLLGSIVAVILRVSGSNRFPSPPARINPQRWLRETLPLN